MGQQGRFRGRVSSPQQVLCCNTRLEVEGEKAGSSSLREPFLCVIDGIGETWIDPAQAALRGFTKVVQRGSWDELEHNPFARGLQDHAPGPHVQAKLVIEGVRAGDAIQIDGTLVPVADTVTSDGYRNVERSSNPQRIVARSITGANAQKERPAQPETPRTWCWLSVLNLPFWLTLVLLGTASVAWLASSWSALPPSASLRATLFALIMAHVAWTLAAALEALSIRPKAFWSATGDLLPGFHRGDSVPPDKVWKGVAWFIGLIFWLTTLLIPMDHIATLTRSQNVEAAGKKGKLVDGMRAAAYMSLGAATFILSLGWGLRRKSARLARVAGKPRTRPDGFSPGAWVTFEGQASSPVTLRVREFRTSTGSGKSMKIDEERLLDGELAVDVAGAPVRIHVPSADWATTCKSAHEVSISRSIGHCRMEEVWSIPVGARVVVAGRWPSEGGTMKGTGPESLVVLETGRWKRPRWSLLWRGLAHHVSLAAAVAGGIVMAALFLIY
ncbi:MAG: hypothetical protein HY898_14720 [Deltaproteobacteria bacterium]|nr:hypothetical protein [Deltaproteobacteria bacterium]